MSETKKPAIRFQGFSDEWEQRKFSDVAPLQRGFDLPTADMKPGKYPVVMSNGIGGYHSEYKAKGPGVITGRSGTIGKLHYIEDNYWPHNTALWVTNFKGNNPKFIYYLYQRLDLGRFGSGSGVPTLNRNDVHDIVVTIPFVDEQEKLAEFIHNLDHFITLYQRKYEKLTIVKKSMLEKMFPQNGSNVPEIRFSGFTDAWEHRKLGDIGSTYTGLAGKTKEDFGHGSGRFVTYMNVFTNPVSDVTVVEPVEIDKAQNEVKFGDVLFTASSETPEEVGMSSVWLENSKNTYLNSFCFGFRPNERFDPYYLAYMLRSEDVRKKITFLAQGISRYNISKSKMMDIEIPIPKEEEQRLLGAFFRRLDHLITLHQQQLNKLQSIKKALLEKMFV